MRRVAVKGTSGAGKTTFSAELARRLHVPHIELDALHHGPNWAEPTADAFSARVRDIMAANPNGWVIDGNYERKLGQLVNDAADTVVWLDLPLSTLMLRLFRRSARRIHAQQELWPGTGNRETWRMVLFDWNGLLPWTLRAFRRHRREWPGRFGSHPGYVRLRTPAEVVAWLDQLHSPAREL
jgi:adenylate kinase family enzyme